MDEYQSKEQLAYQASSILLEVEAEAGGDFVQVPALIKNMSGTTLAIEVINPSGLVGWDKFLKRQARLCLSPGEPGDAACINGTVNWAKWVGEKKWRLQVGVELAVPSLKTYKLLERYLATSPKDIKGLWERYDQNQAVPEPAASNRKFYLAGLLLMLGGLILQLPEPRAIKILGWVLWFFGSLGVAGNSLWSILQKRSSH